MAQLQQLGPAAPIQPVALPSFQYSLANVRVGKSKLSSLADALSGINPALEQFGRLSLAKQQLEQEQAEFIQKQREEAMAKGREAFALGDLDPTGLSEKLKSIARKGAETGVIPEAENVPFLIGGSQALGEVLVRRDYRAMLRDLVSDTVDVEATILQNRKAFLERQEFSDPLVKSFILDSVFDVEDEFRKNVQSRLDDVQVETNKRLWLELGRDSMGQAIAGVVDINDPSIQRWINHPVGIFKGSRKFAWDNLMKEELKEGLTSGNISPTKAKNFLDNLRKLDLGNGVKFADAEVGNSISDFYNYIEDQGAVLEKRGADLANIEFDLLNNRLVDSLLVSLGDGNNVSSVDARAIRETYLSSLPKGISKEKAIDTFDKILGNVNKPADDATKLIVGKLDTFIDEGLELDVAVQEVEGAFRLGPSDGGITAQERIRLLKKIEDARDFDRLIYKDDFYKNIITVDEELITGFVKERAAFGPATYEVGYFTELGVPDDVPAEDRSTDARSVYRSILSKKGPSAAKAFVNRRYNAYEQQFRLAFKDRFDSYERSVSMTPEQAKERVREEAQGIRDKVFKQWERESIILANKTYGLSIMVPSSTTFISPGVYKTVE